MLLDYETLPSDGPIAAACERLGGGNPKPIAPRSERGPIEQFDVDGVPCQIGHLAFADVEADIRKLPHDHDPYALKAIGALHEHVAARDAPIFQLKETQANLTARGLLP